MFFNPQEDPWVRSEGGYDCRDSDLWEDKWMPLVVCYFSGKRTPLGPLAKVTLC